MERNVKSERKTRSMRLKENCEELSMSLIKMGHYVRNPEFEKNNDINQDVPISTRKSRRHTLKEQNVRINSDDDIPVKKHKQSSRIKKIDEETMPDNLDLAAEHNIKKPEVKQKVKKNKKKNQELMFEDVENHNKNIKDTVPKTKKKSKRRKTSKQSSSIKVEDDIEEIVTDTVLNISNASNESYQSAAGSIKSDTFSNANGMISGPEAELMDGSNKKSTRRLSKRNNSIIDKDAEAKSDIIIDSFEKESINCEVKASKSFNKSIEINVSSKTNLDDTYEKPNSDASITTLENVNDEKSLNSSARRSSSILMINASNSMSNLNNTFDKPVLNNTKSLDATFEKEVVQLNGTYDLDDKNSSIKSDINKTIDKANNSHISINSEDSKTENIINITAELVESSDEEISCQNSPAKMRTEKLELPVTPFKREGTYTKESPTYEEKPKEPGTPTSIESGSIESDMAECRTPNRRKSLPSPGFTPFSKESKEKNKTVLNITHSIEKSLRRSSSMEPAPRATKVMFCSPTNLANVSSQIKRKVIKSNMKGSNKSFVFDSSLSELNRSGRKRSYTQNDADEVRSKRSKLENEQKKSVERLSRPRTFSATAKTSEPLTPSKKPTASSKAKPESKVTRTKLPNFTALHQKQFDKMESLDQCQERKAKRARQLLTPTGNVNMLERISPKEKDTDLPPNSAIENAKPGTPCIRKTKPLTLTSLNPGYTRFGFKLNTSVNPFSVPSKSVEDKAKESKLLPSRAGATSARREAAKQTVMREKSFTERNSTKRNESRNFIKGVRTNRRFQLQMQMRNININ